MGPKMFRILWKQSIYTTTVQEHFIFVDRGSGMKQAAKRKKPQRSCSQIKNEQRAIDVNSMAKERMNEVVQESMKRHARESVLPSTAISRGDLKPDTRTPELRIASEQDASTNPSGLSQNGYGHPQDMVCCPTVPPRLTERVLTPSPKTKVHRFKTGPASPTYTRLQSDRTVPPGDGVYICCSLGSGNIYTTTKWDSFYQLLLPLIELYQ